MAATTSSSMALEADEQFRFFSLARDLRNQIYRNLTIDHPRSSTAFRPRGVSGGLTVTSSVNPKLRLVSRQFKGEYEYEALTTTEMVFALDVMGWFDFQQAGGVEKYCLLGSMGLTKRVEKATLRVIDPGYVGAGAAFKTAKKQYLHMIDQLPSLRQLDIDLMGPLQNCSSSMALPYGAFKPAEFLEWRVDVPKERRKNLAGVCDVTIKPTLLLKNKLYRIWPKPGMDDELMDELDDQATNTITYRAVTSASTSSHSWYGLHLEPIESGQFRYAEIQADYNRCKISEQQRQYEALVSATYDYDSSDDDRYYDDGGNDYYWDEEEMGYTNGDCYWDE